MVKTYTTSMKRAIVARMEPGEDVLETIERVAHEHKVTSGHLTLIGAISRAHLGYFALEKKEYLDFSIEQDLEVVSCIGNISTLRDGKTVVHAHMIVADEKGRCYGGHLFSGTTVSVTIELYIFEVDGNIRRGPDARTGLNLLDI